MPFKTAVHCGSLFCKFSVHTTFLWVAFLDNLQNVVVGHCSAYYCCGSIFGKLHLQFNVCKLLSCNFWNLLLIIFLQIIPLVNSLTSHRWPRSVWSIDQWTIDIWIFTIFFAETKMLDGAVCIEAKELNSALFSDKPHLVERNDRDRSESTENISLF